MFFRTDIAVEANDRIKSEIDGVNLYRYQKGGLDIVKVKITNDNAVKAIGKPKGVYITAEIPILTENCNNFFSKAKVVADEIKKLIPNEGLVLVVGLGNSNITADNLGPMTANGIIATRHISKEVKKSIGLENLRSVAVIAPGVLGQTGIEVAEIIKAVAKNICPVCVVVVDAFASSDVKRLGTTVQISNTGISPGSGVLNSRAKISKETVGIPVISIGVPTVIDTRSLLLQILNDEKKINTRVENMIITVREIDVLIERASKFLAMIINSLLQPELTNEDIEMLMS